MVLVGTSSSSVLVDESALTGEATPTGKASIDKSDASQLYDAKEHKSLLLSLEQQSLRSTAMMY